MTHQRPEAPRPTSGPIHIVILIAMRDEARPVADTLALEPIDAAPWPAWMPMTLHQGSVALRSTSANTPTVDLSLVTCGTDRRFGVDLIGTQPATLAASAAIEYLRPDAVLNAGTCGGFASRGADVGQLYLARPPLRFHDRRVPLPGFHEASLGDFPCLHPEPLIRELPADLRVLPGTVSTGDALDASPECLNRMGDASTAAKDMEAAAVAFVCELAGVPFTALKAVTDLVDQDEPTEDAFLRNLRAATARLARAVPHTVCALASVVGAHAAQRAGPTSRAASDHPPTR